MLRQASFDEMGTPLFDVAFCVLDLETTGGSPADCEITEMGAVRYRRGELEGTFQTLVNPGTAIPPMITILTGITHAMVIEAPMIDEALPAFLEFIGDAVIVGHNVRFDMSFLNAAAQRLAYDRLPNRTVDTASLGRRLIRSEVRNLKLGTLAAHFRSPVRPNHRALEDAKATAHVFFELLGRVGTMGVTTLEDLLELPTAKGSPTYSKLSLTEGLPRRAGVYLFQDRHGEIIYVGKATNLRTRVRSYFYGDTRRRVANMLRQLDRIEHIVCATELEAAIVEVRLIHAHRPRFNRRSRPPKADHFVCLTDERFPRVSITRSPREPFCLGPFRSHRAARTVRDAIWDASMVRRCSGKPASRDATCAAAQLGVAMCPCSGSLDAGRYREMIDHLCLALTDDPRWLLEPLQRKVRELAASQRYEEAAWVRDRHAALSRAIERRWAWQSMASAGRVHAESTDAVVCIDRGRLVAAWRHGATPPLLPTGVTGEKTPPVPPSSGAAEEAHLLWRWLTSGAIRLLETDHPILLPATGVPPLTIAA
ncbi:MAG: DEDD exonuclease domain-containing protein [Acidimicrobiia bacterium]|nr:DEDD exonuclease domain-containing protein [Acidimicrobiia bacterium]